MQAALSRRVEEIVLAAEREAAGIQRELDTHRQSVEADAQRYLEDARRHADALVQRRVHRLRQLSDGLVERAETARRQFDALISALERETQRLSLEDPQLPAMPPRRAPPRRSGEVPVTRAAAVPAAPPPPPPRAAPEPPPALRAAVRTPDELRSASSPLGEGAAPSEPRTARERAAALERSWLPAGAPGSVRGESAAEPPARQQGADRDAARMVAIDMAVSGRTRAEVDAHLRENFRLTDVDDLLDDVFGGTGEHASRRTWTDP